MTTPRKVPDDLWCELEPELPAPPSRAKGGRKRGDDRKLLDGRLYVLWTGCPWRALPRQEFGPWQTVYDRFAAWRQAGIFERLWARCLQLYDGKHGIDWRRRDLCAGSGGGKKRPAPIPPTAPNPAIKTICWLMDEGCP